MKGYELEIKFDGEKWTGEKFDIGKMSRRIIIPENTTMEELHQIIQILFGLKSFSYYEFSYDDYQSEDVVNYGYVPHRRFCSSHKDLSRVYVDKYFKKKISFDYEYDYRCEWCFFVRFIRIVEYDKFYPTIVSFKGQYDIVGNCGGPWALEYYLKIISDPPETLSENDLKLINRIEKFDCKKTQEELRQHFDVS